MIVNWIVQENLANEKAWGDFVAAIQAAGAPHQIVKVVPFGHELIPEVETIHNVAFGSLTMERIAIERGWNPGSLSNPNHHFTKWSDGYSGHLLNEDAVILPFGEVPPFLETKFIRPLDDSKVFAGQLIDGPEFKIWQQGVLATQDDFSTLTPETPILMASPKNVEREYRFFIVGEQVVTGSLYREYGRTRLERVESFEHPAWSFAARMANRWRPGAHFVLDVAELPDGQWKVIEINSLTCAGFYDCDPAEIVNGLLDWFSVC